MEFADEDAAMDWMDANQLGRRNLTPDQRSIMRGRRYNRTKKAQGGDRKSEAVSKLQSDTLIDTATALANQHGVSRATVIRDGKRAEAIEKLGGDTPKQTDATTGIVGPLAAVVVHTPRRQNSILGSHLRRG